MKKVNVAILGCGHISRCHLHGYRACSEIAEIRALCDINRDSAVKWAEQFKLDVPIYTDYKEMLSSAEVDAVDICVPIAGHYDTTRASLEAGKHVIVEKPMTDDMEHAVMLHQLSKRVGRKLMVAQCQRFENRFIAVKEILACGLIGKPFAVQAQMAQDVEKLLGFEHWHMQQGGALLSIGVHILDSMRFLFGEVDVVGAMSGQLYAPMRRDDVSTVNLKFKSGILAAVYCSYSSKISLMGWAVLIVHGTKGGLTLANNAITLYSEVDSRYANPAEYPVEPVPSDWRQNQGFLRECREFVESIIEDREPATGSQDNLQTMGVVFAGYESARTGKTIRVDEFLKEKDI